MKKDIIPILATSAALFLAGTTAFAQAQAFSPKFEQGSNGGALEVAQAIFGRSTPVSTAIVDMNNDGQAEIAVKMDDTCNGTTCDFSLLNFSGDRWAILFSGPMTAFSLGDISPNGARDIVDVREEVKWIYGGDGYYVTPVNAKPLREFGEYTTNLSDKEAQNPAVGAIKQLRRLVVDINGDGIQEVYLHSVHYSDCTGSNQCPFVLMDSDGGVIEEGYTQEGAAYFDNKGHVYTLSSNGITKHAFNGTSLKYVNDFDHSKIEVR